MNHFNPKVHAPQFEATSDKRVQMNSVKSSDIAAMRINEVCLEKC